MTEEKTNARLEAFCDAVFAIALTLLIIEVKIPSNTEITSTEEFWHALRHIGPTIFSFVLSFTIILITWVNHHGVSTLVNKSSSTFIFANGFLLLTIVFIPFPTALLGEHLLTDHAAPAVILFSATMAMQAIAWILLAETILRGRLWKNEKSAAQIRQRRNYGTSAFILYSCCALLANWFPLAIAAFTTMIWMFWLILAISLKEE